MLPPAGRGRPPLDVQLAVAEAAALAPTHFKVVNSAPRSLHRGRQELERGTDGDHARLDG